MRWFCVFSPLICFCETAGFSLEYRLGNRSTLEWIVDQYRVKTDKRSGIINDPNREADPQYIVKLIGKVIAVSLETAGDCGGVAGVVG